MKNNTNNDGPLNSRWDNDSETWSTITPEEERREDFANRAALTFWVVTISFALAAALLLFTHRVFTMDQRVSEIRNSATPEARP